MSRIIVIDNHPVTCMGVRVLLENAGHTIVGVADNGIDGLDLCRRCNPDLAVLDLKVPRLGGLDVIRRIRARHETTQVLVFTDLPADIYEHACIENGAAGFVTKSDAHAPLLDAVSAVLAGRTFFHVAAMRLKPGAAAFPDKNQADVLTPREITVLHYLADGYRVKDIATELAISDRTVSTYKARLLEKTNTSSLVELLQFCTQRGLVEPPIKAGGAPPRTPGTHGRFDRLMDSIPYPVTLRDCNGRVMEANAAFLRMVGLTLDQVVGSTATDMGVVAADHIGYLHKSFEAAVKAKIPYMTVCVVYIKGVRHVLKHGGIPVFNEDGELVGMLCSSIDLGEQDKEIQTLREDLEQLRSIRTRRGQYLLDFGLRALRDLHLLQQVARQSHTDDHAQALQQGLAELGLEIERLADLVRLELGQLMLNATRVDLHTLTQQTLDSAASKDLPSCTLHLTGSQPFAWADAQRYTQLIRTVLVYAQSLGVTQIEVASTVIETSAAHVQWTLAFRAVQAPGGSADPLLTARVLVELLTARLGGTLQDTEQGPSLNLELVFELPRSTSQ